MLRTEELAYLRSLSRRIADELSQQAPGDESLRYAYRLATATALSLADQLDELATSQKAELSLEDLRIAS